jgi:hypothetical protein
MATWADVRVLALALPEAAESTSYRKLAFKVRGTSFAWESPHEAGALAVKVDADEKELLLAANPAAYWSTPHYEGYAIVLVRLEALDLTELRERITDSWLLAAPAKLAATLEL